MLVAELKSNSDKSKELAKQTTTKKVISGKARLKKSGGGKLKELFVAEDIGNVKNYIIHDVLVPALKKAFYDVIVNGLSISLYGDTRMNTRSDRPGSNVSYVSYYDRDRRNDYTPSYRGRSGYSYRDVVVDSRTEAIDILDRMDEAIQAYGIVTVLDLYDFAGLPTYPTDNKYGWSSIRDAQIAHERDGGWVIKLPKPLPIN